MKEVPKICKILGVNPMQKFQIVGYEDETYFITSDGQFTFYESGKTFLSAGSRVCAAIENGVIPAPAGRWTEEDVKDAHESIRLLGVSTVVRDSNGLWLKTDDGIGWQIVEERFPSVRVGDTVKLEDILGGSDDAVPGE